MEVLTGQGRRGRCQDGNSTLALPLLVRYVRRFEAGHEGLYVVSCQMRRGGNWGEELGGAVAVV